MDLEEHRQLTLDFAQVLKGPHSVPFFGGMVLSAGHAGAADHARMHIQCHGDTGAFLAQVIFINGTGAVSLG